MGSAVATETRPAQRGRRRYRGWALGRWTAVLIEAGSGGALGEEGRTAREGGGREERLLRLQREGLGLVDFFLAYGGEIFADDLKGNTRTRGIFLCCSTTFVTHAEMETALHEEGTKGVKRVVALVKCVRTYDTFEGYSAGVCLPYYAIHRG